MRTQIAVSVLFGLGCSHDGPPRIEAPPNRPVEIAAGDAFECVLAGGAVRCCGNGWNGQLGNGAAEDEGHLVDVLGLRDVTAIAAGGFHACALHANGSVSCWGENKFDQLGYAAPARSESPHTVEGLGAPAKGIALGIIHSCALMLDGTVRCWGANNGIGIGDKDRVSSPTPIPGLDDVVEIAASSSHTCARRTSGSVACWGDDGASQLATPVVVANLSDAVQIALTDDGGCARLRDGVVSCWGGRSPWKATVVPGVANVVEISARSARTCARKSDGSIVCWGSDVKLAPPTPWPSAKPANGFLAVAVGGGHICALDKSHALVCEGANSHGELCIGTNPPRSKSFPPPP